MLRLCRLLTEEYSSLNEKILIESPFAEISEEGEGLRQVQLALTKKHILIGEDRFDPEQTESLSNVYYETDLEPQIETMHLIQMIPLRVVRFKIFRRKERELLKMTIGNLTKVMYFEFGGHLLRRMYWIIWKDKIDSIQVAYEQNPKFVPYIDPFEDSETAWTSNSEYEMPRTVETFADTHSIAESDAFLVKESDAKKDEKETIKSPSENTIQTIQRYFVDVLTNSRLRIIDKYTAYQVMKTKSDTEYIFDLSHMKYPDDSHTLTPKSASCGLIRFEST